MRTFLTQRGRSSTRVALLFAAGLALALIGPEIYQQYSGETRAGIAGGLLAIYASLAAGLGIAAAGASTGATRWAWRVVVLVLFGGGFAAAWFPIAHFAGSSWTGWGGVLGVIITVVADCLAEPPHPDSGKVTVRCCSCLAADPGIAVAASQLGMALDSEPLPVARQAAPVAQPSAPVQPSPPAGASSPGKVLAPLVGLLLTAGTAVLLVQRRGSRTAGRRRLSRLG
jgi:hypothetical protein